MKYCTACLSYLDDAKFLSNGRYRYGFNNRCSDCIINCILSSVKICCNCNLPLSFEHFNKQKATRDGFTTTCKLCKKVKDKEYVAKNIDALLIKGKVYRDNNRELINKKKKDYRDNNSEKIKVFAKKHYNKNKVEINRKAIKYQKLHPEIRKKITRAYYLKNKEYYHLKVLERLARKQKLTIQKFSVKDLNDRMAVFGFKCAYCGGPFQHIDHVKPMIKNGLHCLSNLRPSCRKCNLSKGSKSLLEWKLFKEKQNGLVRI
jgi:5-methylcytosine-specific restriction endonuclease McrA